MPHRLTGWPRLPGEEPPRFDPRRRRRLEHRNGRLAQAIEALERVVELDPTRGEAWNLLAVSSWQNKDEKAAREAFDRALDAAPFLPEALVGAGGFALSRGDLPTAKRMLARLEALEVFGPTPEAEALRKRLADQQD